MRQRGAERIAADLEFLTQQALARQEFRPGAARDFRPENRDGLAGQGLALGQRAHRGRLM
ncbi:MAG: hypothetical protein WDM96_16755 [Lacunisphaera sp.]